jgi:uncharacterized protein (DUF2384 family)
MLGVESICRICPILWFFKPNQTSRRAVLIRKAWACRRKKTSRRLQFIKFPNSRTWRWQNW